LCAAQVVEKRTEIPADTQKELSCHNKAKRPGRTSRDVPPGNNRDLSDTMGRKGAGSSGGCNQLLPQGKVARAKICRGVNSTISRKGDQGWIDLLLTNGKTNLNNFFRKNGTRWVWGYAAILSVTRQQTGLFGVPRKGHECV